MLNNYGKIAGITSFLSLFLLILGVKYVLGQDLIIMNFVAFTAFSIVVGITTAALLLYKLHKAYYLFTVGLAIGFMELFRSFFVESEGLGDILGILSLFIITSFGLVVGLTIEGILYILKMNK